MAGRTSTELRGAQSLTFSGERTDDRTMTAVIEPTGEVRESEALGARVQHTLHRHPAIGPASVLVVSVIVFTIINPRFINAPNLSLLVQQVAVLATLAIGQTMIILTGGIDLSVG